MASYCPNCLAENAVGALVCKQCGTLFTPQGSSTFSPSSESAISPNLRQEVFPSPPRTAHIDRLKANANAIALYVGQQEQPIIVDVISQATLGRGAAGSDIQPSVDLNPLGAYDKGVSRIHVILRRKDGALTIEDNGSSNGTWVNGRRIEPFTPIQLVSSNEIRLGQLPIQVYLNSETVSNPAPSVQESSHPALASNTLEQPITFLINKNSLDQLAHLQTVLKQLLESGNYEIKVSIEAHAEKRTASQHN